MRYVKPDMAYICVGIEESVAIMLCIQTPNDRPIRGEFREDKEGPSGCAGPVKLVDFTS